MPMLPFRITSLRFGLLPVGRDSSRFASGCHQGGCAAPPCAWIVNAIDLRFVTSEFIEAEKREQAPVEKSIGQRILVQSGAPVSDCPRPKLGVTFDEQVGEPATECVLIVDGNRGLFELLHLAVLAAADLHS